MSDKEECLLGIFKNSGIIEEDDKILAFKFGEADGKQYKFNAHIAECEIERMFTNEKFKGYKRVMGEFNTKAGFVENSVTVMGFYYSYPLLNISLDKINVFYKKYEIVHISPKEYYYVVTTLTEKINTGKRSENRELDCATLDISNEYDKNIYSIINNTNLDDLKELVVSIPPFQLDIKDAIKRNEYYFAAKYEVEKLQKARHDSGLKKGTADFDNSPEFIWNFMDKMLIDYATIVRESSEKSKIKKLQK